jgi:bla regulator protein BlaR1
MEQFNFLFSPAAEALGYALLYSLGQAFVVFICLRIVLKFIPNASSNIKYSLSYASYVGIASWFFITLIRQISISQNDAVYQQRIANTAFTPMVLEHITSSTSSFFSITFLNQYLPFIVAFYLVGIFWYSIRLSVNFFQTNGLKTKGVFELDAEWQEHISRLAGKMKISRSLQTFFSKKVNTPVMIGFFKPVILLPFAIMNQLSPQQFEAILLHELAHIRRNDYVLNILQSVLDTILFFNPFAWWITKNIREEREKSCDEMVLQFSDPYHYARALLSLEEPLTNHPLIMTAVGKRSHLFHRIKNIMEMKKNRLNLRQKFITLLVIASATFSVAWLSPGENKMDHSEKQKNDFPKASVISTSSFFTFLPFNLLKDSTPKEIAPMPPAPPPSPMPPVSMTNPGTPPPSPPMPPFPPTAPLPPNPLFGEMIDSLPPSTDYFNSKEWKQQEEAIKKNTEKMRKYFQSDAWKKQQDLMRENALAQIQKFVQSEDWQKQQQLMKKNGEETKKYFNSAEWKKQQDLIKKNAEEMVKHFNSTDWKKQQELIQKNAEKVKEYFNSPEWKKQQEEIHHATDSLSAYFKSDDWKKQQENVQKALAQIQNFFQSEDWQKQQENLKELVKDQKQTQNDADLKKK